jgi:hypothetical protein
MPATALVNSNIRQPPAIALNSFISNGNPTAPEIITALAAALPVAWTTQQSKFVRRASSQTNP